VDAERSPRWVRVKFGGETIADSRKALLLMETGQLPVYYFPPEDVRMDLMEATDRHSTCPYKGLASYWTIRVGDRVADNAVWGYLDPLPAHPEIKGYLAFYWNKVDAWFEEEEEIYAHPRDPYHRVDALPSTRHIRVVLGGETIAETNRPHLLFETSLPTRYYVPREDVRMELLTATEKHTRCPYKGEASYWTAKAGGEEYPDIVWSYPDPIPECPSIRGLLAFFNEKVDTYVDGELQARPRTKWS
jgi:uncharacterized protein (DUF427 family)